MSPAEGTDAAARRHEWRLERLISRLPGRLQVPTRWLRRPSSRWLRVPVGLLLIAGGVLSILPFLGLWMLPLGLVLLAEDVPRLRLARERILAGLERRRPQWFTSADTSPATRCRHISREPGEALPAGSHK